MAHDPPHAGGPHEADTGWAGIAAPPVDPTWSAGPWAAAPPPAPQPAPQPVPPPRRRRTLPLVLAVVTALALVAGLATVLALTQRDDDRDGEQAERASASGPATDFDAVNERYASLAGVVTTGMDACEAADTASGESEHLTCTWPGGELTLVTYAGEQDLQATRAREIDFSQIGGRHLDGGTGVVYSIAPQNDPDDTVDAPSLYWDSTDGLQAARYRGAPDGALDDLVALFTSTQPSLDYPTAPTDPDLQAFAANFVTVEDCERIDTLAAGETEELSCPDRRGVTPYFGKFATVADLRAYRRAKLELARADGTTNRTWNLDGARAGALYDYTIDADGRAARYWDDPDCLCYGEAYFRTGNAAALDAWWKS